MVYVVTLPIFGNGSGAQTVTEEPAAIACTIESCGTIDWPADGAVAQMDGLPTASACNLIQLAARARAGQHC